MKVLLLAFSVFFISQLNAGVLDYKYSFGNPEIVQDEGRQLINVDQLPQSITAGMPVLPFKTVKLLLPPGSRVKDIVVVRKKIKQIKISDIKIAAQIIPYTHLPMDKQIPSLKKLVFNYDYPSPMTARNNQAYHGYDILLMNIHPVYIDTERKFWFAGEIDIRVLFNDDKVVGRSLEYNQEVLDYVDNPEIANPFLTMKRESVYDYLILSSADLVSYQGANSLHKYKEFIENKRGLKIKIVDVKKAINGATGRDNAEKLRNYIKTEYKNNGIKYLLLAADSDGSSPVIPVRDLYSEVNGYLNGQWKLVKEQIHSDFYYSCLDGNFNSDGDNKWGEPNDGPDGADVDFLCELTVGRWPVDNSSELASVVAKTIKGFDLKARNKNVLLAGEHLFDKPPLWGGDYMDKLVGKVDDHGFITNGYDSSWKITKMYDKEKYWRANDLKNKVASGDFLMLNHIGHSNQNSGLRTSGWFFNGFSNKNPFFLYTQGCLSGDYTADATIIEKMVFGKGGPFAAVANTNYGLGPEDPEYDSTDTPGTSEILHRFFVNRVLGENYLAFGESHKKSKEDILIYIEHQEARWVIWSTTFFGDPVLAP